MKKKFLALALAAAVMAPTTSAFAQTTIITSPDGNTQTVAGSKENTHEADVRIEGSVLKSDGSAPAGKIQVELPTATGFVVREDGQVTGSNFNIKNTGGTDVQVVVSQFIESIPDGGINIKKDLTPDQAENFARNTVKLTIEATQGSENTSFALDKTISDIDLISVPAGKSAAVYLTGIAGTKTTDDAVKVEQEGATENFTLKFKIKKA